MLTHGDRHRESSKTQCNKDHTIHGDRPFRGLLAKVTNVDSLSEYSKAHTIHGDRPFRGFLSQINPGNAVKLTQSTVISLL
jgi:hypothetical protein